MLLAAEECGVRSPLYEKDYEVEFRMETVSHVAALVAQQLNCTPMSGKLCTADEGTLGKIRTLQDWASQDEGWDRIYAAYVLYNEGSQHMAQEDYSAAAAAFEQAMAYRVFPYMDTKMLEHWQRALAMPGQLFRKQRLDLADVLLLSADSRLEMAQNANDLNTLESAMKTLELSVALREADGDTEASRMSEGYARTLHASITQAMHDMLPKLKVKELQLMLADRGLSCSGCVEKLELLEKLVPSLRLPAVPSDAQPLPGERVLPRMWVTRSSSEEPSAFLRRVLTSVVDSFSIPLLEEMEAWCGLPSQPGCQLFPLLPSTGADEASQRKNASSCQASHEADSRGGREDAVPSGSAQQEKGDAGRSGNKAGAAPVGGAGTATADGNRTGLRSSSGLCHQMGLRSACADGSCMDTCGLVEKMLSLEEPELQRVVKTLSDGEPIQSMARSLAQLDSAPSGSAPGATAQRSAGAADAGLREQHPGPSRFEHLDLTEEAFRSERDRQLQEQLVRRSRDVSEYEDDPLVPILLGVCVLCIAMLYLGRRHRRSISRVLGSWLSVRGALGSQAPTLGTSVSKERQAAAASLRAALARSDITAAELQRCLEAAEATDVEGPLVRRGHQTLAQRRRRERDAAESGRSKGKTGKDRDAGKGKRDEQKEGGARGGPASKPKQVGAGSSDKQLLSRSGSGKGRAEAAASLPPQEAKLASRTSAPDAALGPRTPALGGGPEATPQPPAVEQSETGSHSVIEVSDSASSHQLHSYRESEDGSTSAALHKAGSGSSVGSSPGSSVSDDSAAVPQPHAVSAESPRANATSTRSSEPKLSPAEPEKEDGPFIPAKQAKLPSAPPKDGGQQKPPAEKATAEDPASRPALPVVRQSASAAPQRQRAAATTTESAIRRAVRQPGMLQQSSRSARQLGKHAADSKSTKSAPGGTSLTVSSGLKWNEVAAQGTKVASTPRTPQPAPPAPWPMQQGQALEQQQQQQQCLRPCLDMGLQPMQVSDAAQAHPQASASFGALAGEHTQAALPHVGVGAPSGQLENPVTSAGICHADNNAMMSVDDLTLDYLSQLSILSHQQLPPTGGLGLGHGIGQPAMFSDATPADQDVRLMGAADSLHGVGSLFPPDLAAIWDDGLQQTGPFDALGPLPAGNSGLGPAGSVGLPLGSLGPVDAAAFQPFGVGSIWGSSLPQVSEGGVGTSSFGPLGWSLGQNGRHMHEEHGEML
eukprot:CAMPEP_0177608720 /NCGR_PEP_ID=MMETSP0419_2-20121207/18631_1 /TAXON_ID=582737 /ORGANISM="Tetraselmis sp., Strain GSL018" /LENGTH=1218 /DNA_ID=CAMNT_0019103447 /DNA_START=169 /DNA_END=3825 /DNA_ORIENTATION=+